MGTLFLREAMSRVEIEKGSSDMLACLLLPFSISIVRSTRVSICDSKLRLELCS